jgi:hypothetical protein
MAATALLLGLTLAKCQASDCETAAAQVYPSIGFREQAIVDCGPPTLT